MADRTYLELQDEVLAHGFDAGVYRARVKRWLNDADRRLARRLEIANRQAASTIVTAVGIASYPLPVNFVSLAREDRYGALRVVEAGPDRQLTEISTRDFDSLDESRNGTPTHFALEGDQVLVWPTPATVETMEMRHWASAAGMSGDSDTPGTPDEYAELLVSFALSRAYKSEDDPEMSAFHWSEWERDTQRMGVDLQERSSGPRQVEGMLALWGDC